MFVRDSNAPPDVRYRAHMRQLWLGMPLLLTLCATVARGSERQEPRPVPQINRVLIVSVDGLRPDLLIRAEAPNLRALCRRGSFTFWAKTTAASITVPSMVSMLTGVVPEAHAIMWNGDLPLAAPVYPTSPTIFELAKRAGYSTAIVAGKSKLAVLVKPKTVDWQWIAESATTEDQQVIESATRILASHRPELMFVHFPSVDNVGHAKGWGTDEQLVAVEEVDRCIGSLIELLAREGLDRETLLIITADHGGAGRTHGAEDARSRTIPWIVVGPGVRANLDLTRLGRGHDVEIFDTFATTCAVLGIPVKHSIDGVFVREAFEHQELLLSTYRPSMQPTTKPAEE
jgi:hypothetical protein